jgi:hypothetical protein
VSFTLHRFDMTNRTSASYDGRPMKITVLHRTTNIPSRSKRLNRLRISISNWRPSLSESDKERVVEFLKSIETGDEAPLCYVDPGKYVQHNLNIGDGLEG